MKIESGKLYRDRWGDVHGPMDERQPGCFLDQYGAVYQPNGQQWNHLPASMSTLEAEASTVPSADRCARCGHPRAEHSYNGDCYGLCGEFVSPVPSTPSKTGV